MFELFNRQQEAFDRLDAIVSDAELVVGPPRLKVFSLETVSGQRKFVVASLSEFWKRYLALPLRDRHFYEIIREGTPCRLYFDVEFDRTCNVHLDGDSSVELLIYFVAQQMQVLYGISLMRRDFLDLDSRSPLLRCMHDG